jgi:hypothetical protein
MSGFLLLLSIDYTMKRTTSGTPTGIRWNFTANREDIDFVYDLALISLNIYNQKQRNYDLKINAAKTNVMKLDTTNREHVNLKDEQVQVVDTFIYLGGGVVVTSIEGCDEDIKNRLERASVKL